MKRVIILSTMLLGIVAVDVRAQMRLTIEECYEKARTNYPLIEQYKLIEKSAEYSLANVAKGWLPQITFSAQVSYQSDVTQLPFDRAQLSMMGVDIPELRRDQYGVKVEVSQMIWDGGATEARKMGVRAASEAERTSIEANIYALRERVNGLYFGILLADGQLKQLALLEDNLTTNYRRMESCVRSGIAMQADLDAIYIEQLKAGQQKVQLTATKRAYLEMLSRLVGEELGADAELTVPTAVRPAANVVERPELAMYESQIQSIRARSSNLNTAITPRLALFATGGYGRPGLNMLSGNFEPYYIVGMRLSWNIGGFYTRKNDLRQIQTDIQSVQVKRDLFMFNTALDIAQRNIDIDRLSEQLCYDDKIIELRSSIRRSSEAGMENGTVSGSDLVREINAENSAQQDKILHEMELLMAIYNLKFVINN